MSTIVEKKEERSFISGPVNINSVRYEIRCSNCNLEMYKHSRFGPLDDIKSLQDRWNNRVTPTE